MKKYTYLLMAIFTYLDFINSKKDPCALYVFNYSQSTDYCYVFARTSHRPYQLFCKESQLVFKICTNGSTEISLNGLDHALFIFLQYRNK